MSLSFWHVLGLGLGIALIIEGLLPFAAPVKWRQVVQQIQQLQDGQLRYFGLISIGMGLGLLLVLMP